MLRGRKLSGKVIIFEDSAIERYSRKKGSKIELALEEIAFLLEKSKIKIRDKEGKEINLGDFLKIALNVSTTFPVKYIVYRDLKERGYNVKPTEVDFLLYPRGSKPGEKPSRYFIRILSEREDLAKDKLVEMLLLACNMGKELILAVVDEESEITYYEIKEVKFLKREVKEEEEKGNASLLQDRVILLDADLSEKLYRENFYGRLTKEKRLLLSLVEAAYLMKKGGLDIEVNGKTMSFEEFFEHAKSVESDFKNKYAVYEDLRNRGRIIKTGFKFGSHFRVYEEIGQGHRHSKYLIHVVSKGYIFALPELSRAVRLAHSVKKRMIFGYIEGKSIKYIDIGRIKL